MKDLHPAAIIVARRMTDMMARKAIAYGEASAYALEAAQHLKCSMDRMRSKLQNAKNDLIRDDVVCNLILEEEDERE